MKEITLESNKRIPFKRSYCEVTVHCPECKVGFTRFCYDVENTFLCTCPRCKEQIKITFKD